MIGKRFGRWEVIDFAPSGKNGDRMVLCKCSCGTERAVRVRYLKNEISKSCGCLKHEADTTHGETRGSRTVEYKAWCFMKNRCRSNPRYENVDVCRRWENSYETFLYDMGRCSPGLTLDRINPFDGYKPINCRWATPKQQANNRKAHYRAVAALGRPLKNNECLFFANGENRTINFAIVEKTQLQSLQRRRKNSRR